MVVTVRGGGMVVTVRAGKGAGTPAKSVGTHLFATCEHAEVRH